VGSRRSRRGVSEIITVVVLILATIIAAMLVSQQLLERGRQAQGTATDIKIHAAKIVVLNIGADGEVVAEAWIQGGDYGEPVTICISKPVNASTGLAYADIACTNEPSPGGKVRHIIFKYTGRIDSFNQPKAESWIIRVLDYNSGAELASIVPIYVRPW